MLHQKAFSFFIFFSSFMIDSLTLYRPVSSIDNINFANSLDPDQARQNVGHDLDPNCLTLMVFLKENFENVSSNPISLKTFHVCSLS